MPVDGVNAFGAQNAAAASGYARTAETKGTGGLNYNRADVAATSDDMTMTDFYKLMAAQMITALAQMTSTNMITYATSMLGKDVRMAEVDAQGRGTGEYTKGTITGVSLAGESPILYIGDKAYSMAQIMDVGDVKLKEETEDGDGSTEGGETEGDGGTSEGEAV